MNILAMKSSLLASLFIFAAVACSTKGEQQSQTAQAVESGDCFVQLFDGGNFTDDQIKIEGPGEFANLENLPGATKNWDDEADSFKSGKSTEVTFWTKVNFQGDSIVYKNGAQKSSIDEPRSMKIRCTN